MALLLKPQERSDIIIGLIKKASDARKKWYEKEEENIELLKQAEREFKKELLKEKLKQRRRRTF